MSIRNLLRGAFLLGGLGAIATPFLLEDEPAAFGRIRELSSKVKQKAMEAAADELANQRDREHAKKLAGLADLLAIYGSFGDGTPTSEDDEALVGEPLVLHAFVVPALAAGAQVHGPKHSARIDDDEPPSGADPALDTAVVELSLLPAPPRHLVSLVVLGEQVARAVVDAGVINLGDSIGAGRVVEIHPHGIVVKGLQGKVAYDVGSAEGRRLAPAELDLGDAP